LFAGALGIKILTHQKCNMGFCKGWGICPYINTIRFATPEKKKVVVAYGTMYYFYFSGGQFA
jgi:hypothetical protein